MNILPLKTTIQFQDLEKVDIRVGTIQEVIDLKESAKLVKLIVDFGNFTRQIIVGLKQERDNPQSLVGLQALFVVNLASRIIMGETSEGMIFDLGYANHITPVLAVPEKPVPNGTQAG